MVALRKESVDRNSLMVSLLFSFSASLSARRAWIEISRPGSSGPPGGVALRKESVDRNVSIAKELPQGDLVALRKESVDRNVCRGCCLIGCSVSLSARRAWIEMFAVVAASLAAVSLSARRAWIEIAARASSLAIRSWSLSARRAWIEMEIKLTSHCQSPRRSPQGERG